MKEVSEIIAARLKSIPDTFSSRLIFEFNSFFTFLLENQYTKKILDNILKEKLADHKTFIEVLHRFITEEKKRILYIRKELKNFPSLLKQLNPKIQILTQTFIDENQLSSPFFEIEKLFIDFRETYESVIRDIVENESCTFIIPFTNAFCSLRPRYFDVAIPFKHMDELQKEVDLLAGRRKSSLWGQWDILLQWHSWIKDGITSANDALVSNMANLFTKTRINIIIRSVGLCFVERLANCYESGVNESCRSEVSMAKALELFLDDNDQYWIILHKKIDDKTPIFIKRVKRDLASHELLKKLLNEDPATIKLEHLSSHTLGEIELKGEMRKVFFSEGQFFGPYVELDGFKGKIDLEAILRRLFSIDRDKKAPSSFPWGTYHKSKSFS